MPGRGDSRCMSDYGTPSPPCRPRRRRQRSRPTARLRPAAAPAGLPVGPGETLAARRGPEPGRYRRPRRCMPALHGVMVHRHEHFEVFDQAFLLFWRDPRPAERCRMAHAGRLQGAGQKPPPAGRRVAEALTPPTQPPRQPPASRRTKPPIEVAITVSERERLQAWISSRCRRPRSTTAKQEIRKLSLPLHARPTRRFRPDPPRPGGRPARHAAPACAQGGEILT